MLIVSSSASAPRHAYSALFVLDREVLSSLTLILSTDKIGNLLILCLFDGRFVALIPCTETILLNIVDACKKFIE